ncbi:MAG: GAF domain-containing sensor histidine kinase, partial [Clostridia bacterium]|nr:GAF domain-containing sensor histidine kinase [Clostridia bacterium]
MYGSLLKHIVQAAPNEDPSDFVLEAIGRSVGADRCYVCRFREPGKSSMCTNTHEWRADGIKPEIGGQQTCNLEELVEFNACIMSGRDFLSTDISAIDAGSREWLAPPGIQSLIATPLVGADNAIFGFVGFDFVKAPCKEFTDRIIFNIHQAADLLLNCQRMHEQDMARLDVMRREEERQKYDHDLTVALNFASLKAEGVEFIFKHHNYEAIREFIGTKVCKITGAQHLMLCADDGSRSDWFGEDAPGCCRDCAKASARRRKQLPQEFFAESEVLVFRDGEPMPDMNRPPYCQMTSSAVAQFKKGDGWWRLVADYTKPHKHNMDMVARGLHTALEFLSIAYDRDHREKTIAQLQEHQRFRSNLLAYALARDDLPGLIELIMCRLLALTACDYIAIHSVDGDHRLLYPGEELKTCPRRCETCAFYKLLIPPVEDADHLIELIDTKGQTIASLPPECPAKSLEVVVVYSEGKPWGGIALHYMDRQHKISENDRCTLKIAANVLTLALERHAAAVRLKNERDRVVEAEKTRSYFFSAVSHDIRTPLNAIIGFSELLQAGDVPPEDAKQALNMIVSSGKMLLQLVNDVLDLSKMDLGKLTFSLEPADVGELLREVVPAFQPMMAKNGQTFVLEIDEMPRLMVDPLRFRQVMFNYVSNAVKYAGPCTIRISSTYEDGRFKLTVADNGRGVPPEKAKRLMQPFVQADIKNRAEGRGLGLAICKRLVELAHGTISIDTAPGKGFAIHVEVPVD